MTGKRSGVVAAGAAVIAGLALLSQWAPGPVGLGMMAAGSLGEASRTLAWLVAGVAPWLVGAWLLRRRPRLGTAVLITSAALAAPETVASLVRMVTGLVGWSPQWLLVQLLVWSAMSVAGVAAWAGRPQDGWRADGDVPVWLLAPIVLASTPVLVAATTGGWLATGMPAIRTVTEVLAILLTLGVLVVGVIVLFRLRRGVAAVVLLAAAGPALVTRLGSIVAMAADAPLQRLPGGVAALVGNVILVAVAILWLLRDDAAVTPAGTEESALPTT